MYLIDGHNLIGSGLAPDINLEQEDDEARLVSYLRARQSNLGSAMLVVFDGGIPGGFSLQLSGGGVNVVFASASHSDADAVILARIEKHKHPGDCIVVSNDATLLRQAAALNAQVLRVADFLERLTSARRRPPSRPPRPQMEPKTPEAEVEEWLKAFKDRQRHKK